MLTFTLHGIQLVVYNYTALELVLLNTSILPKVPSLPFLSIFSHTILMNLYHKCFLYFIARVGPTIAQEVLFSLRAMMLAA